MRGRAPLGLVSQSVELEMAERFVQPGAARREEHGIQVLWFELAPTLRGLVGAELLSPG